MTKADDKIDATAAAAKGRAGKVIDDVADLASRAASKAKHQARVAGEKVKHAGERILKLAE